MTGPGQGFGHVFPRPGDKLPGHKAPVSKTEGKNHLFHADTPANFIREKDSPRLLETAIIILAKKL
jgi:hypothetical protein